MSKVIHFFSGLVMGVYISQNYHVPNMNTSIKYIFDQISYYEKYNNNNNNK